MGPEDSVSQIATSQGAPSTTSSKLLARQFDLYRRRAALRAIHVSDLAWAEAKEDAAAAVETDAAARLRIGEAKLEAEEKYIARLKVAHQWEFRVDMNKNGLICVTILEKSET